MPGISISASLKFWNAIDDYQYNNRVKDRSEAVRRLVKMGLTYERKTKEELEHAPLVEAVP